MNIIFVLIPLGLVLLATAVAFFFWAVRSGQFDDLDAQGSLVLFDDEAPLGAVRSSPESVHAATGEQ